MVNAQEWLDKYYPLEGTCQRKEGKSWGNWGNLEPYKNFGKTRAEIKELNTHGNQLTGSLNLTGFINLEKLECSVNQLTNLDCTNCPQLKEINCGYNNFTSLTISNQAYLKWLGCSFNDQLTTLTVLNNPQLTQLNCFHNFRLTTLTLINNPRLAELNCWNNRLTNLNFLTNLNKESLTSLSICDNTLTGELSQFSEFTKLEHLNLNNNYLTGDLAACQSLINLQMLLLNNNKITGSLQSLQGLSKLEDLRINDTSLTTGLEYLPESLANLYCNGQLAEQLKDYKDKGGLNCYKYQAWRNDYQELIKLKEIKPILQKEIGIGGFASVHQALWKNQPVAVKKSLIPIQLISSKEISDIEKEIKLLEKLRNKYIIQYYDLYKDKTDLMIIMELADHGSLDKFIANNKDNPHNWPLNYNFIKQITLGLSYLHDNNIIHRDLKSLNILICEGLIAKISDFGLSKVINNLTATRSLTKGIVGSICWMDPYLFKKGNIACFETDIYALGMTIWEICARKLPFSDIDGNLVLGYIISGTQEEIPNDTPIVLKKIIQGCWKNNFKKRIKLTEITNKLNSLQEQNDDYQVQIEMMFNYRSDNR